MLLRLKKVKRFIKFSIKDDPEVFFLGTLSLVASVWLFSVSVALLILA